MLKLQGERRDEFDNLGDMLWASEGEGYVEEPCAVLPSIRGPVEPVYCGLAYVGEKSPGPVSDLEAWLDTEVVDAFGRGRVPLYLYHLSMCLSFSPVLSLSLALPLPLSLPLSIPFSPFLPFSSFLLSTPHSFPSSPLLCLSVPIFRSVPFHPFPPLSLFLILDVISLPLSLTTSVCLSRARSIWIQSLNAFVVMYVFLYLYLVLFCLSEFHLDVVGTSFADSSETVP